MFIIGFYVCKKFKFIFRLYLIVASSIVRPTQVYRVCVSLVPTPSPVIVRASIHRNGEQVVSASDTVDSKDGHLTTLLMQVTSGF